MEFLAFLCFVALGLAMTSLWIVVTTLKKVAEDITNFVTIRTNALSQDLTALARENAKLQMRLEHLDSEVSAGAERQSQINKRIESEIVGLQTWTTKMENAFELKRHRS